MGGYGSNGTKTPTNQYTATHKFYNKTNERSQTIGT